MTNYNKYYNIISMILSGNYTQAEIVSNCACSYGTISRAKKWYYSEIRNKIDIYDEKNSFENYYKNNQEFLTRTTTATTSTTRKKNSYVSSRKLKEKDEVIPGIISLELLRYTYFLLTGSHRTFNMREYKSKIKQLLIE